METFKLYGVINKATGKLISDITNPRHKYWEKKGSAESAVRNYKSKVRYYGRVGKYNSDDLEVVEIDCRVIVKE